MRSRPDAFMPLWIGDYLADTTHLTTEQHGAYLLLLMAYWRRGAPLPADDHSLCAQAKVTMYKWKALRPVMAAFFDEVEGKWVSKRADAELAKAEKFHNSKAAAGRKGAEVRKINASRATYVPPNNVVPINSAAREVSSSIAPSVPKGSAEVETAELSQVNGSSAASQHVAESKHSHSPMRTRTTVSSNPDTLSLVEPLEVSPKGKTPPRPAQKPISSKREKGTRWTAEVVPEDWIAHAQAAYPMVDCQTEAVAFVNFWISCAGANAWKLNWRATWMGWVLREAKEIKRRHGYVRPNGTAQGQPGATSKFQNDIQRELAELEAIERARAH